ncbi:UNVERIFIED_CONTAM: hypothetical protein HDU68_010541 [Siphonaria sp. JEL0065]|nr:hypothetical protein HDU68_010541 [Siphonaria sp. JEL0065]
MEAWALTNIPEWTNDQRMSALFSRFPDRSVNGQVYEVRTDAKSRFKGGLITNSALTIQASYLAPAFKRKGLTPLGMDTVIDEMRKLGALVPVTQYLNSGGDSNGWSLTSLVTLPFRLVFGSSTGSGVEVEELVVLALVQEYAMRLSDYVKNVGVYPTDYIHSPEKLIHKVFNGEKDAKSVKWEQLDCCLLVKYLENSGKAIVEWDANRNPIIVKFLVSPSNGSKKISETDKGILHILMTIDSIQDQITQLDFKIDQLKSNAKKALSANQKQVALSYLRQKKDISSVLDKRVASLQTLETILSKIQQAETDQEILAAYSAGTSTLKTLIASSGVTAERVENVMTELEDTLADAAEIEDAIAFHTNGVLEISSLNSPGDELERELELLVAGELQESEKARKEERNVNDLVDQLNGLVVESSVVVPEAENSKRADKENAVVLLPAV